MDRKRAFWSTTRFTHLAAALLMSAASVAPAFAQSAPPAPVPAPAADSTRAAPAPVSAARNAGCAEAERDADSQHDPLLYGILGAVTGPIGVGLALSNRPQPSTAAMAGLSPEASVEYTRCYGTRARRKNVKAAANGFAISAIVAVTAIFYMDSKTAP